MTEDRDRASFNVVPQYQYFRTGLMGKFATGKNSYAISDRSGFRYQSIRTCEKSGTGL